MENLKIITYPNKILEKKSSLIKKEEIATYQDLASAMINVMLAHNGVGLAAPQIGRNICLIVISKAVHDQQKDLILFNPKISFASNNLSVIEEGCLSLPNMYKAVQRPDKVRVKAQNEKGEKIQIKGKGFFAHVLQHEIDHLNGILIIDREING